MIKKFIPDNTYLFVDGGYLQKLIDEIGNKYFRAPVTADYEKIMSHAQAVKAFYYDAFPSQKENETSDAFRAKSDEASRNFDAIASTRGWHVYFGETRGSKKIRQKGVDVRLALDAFAHVTAGNCNKVILLAGDLDFFPLVEALVKAGAWVELWCDLLWAPKELLNLADSKKPICPRHFHSCLSNLPPHSIPHWHGVGTLPPDTAIKTTAKNNDIEISLYDDPKGPIAIKRHLKDNSLSCLTCDNFQALEYIVKHDEWQLNWRNSKIS